MKVIVAGSRTITDPNVVAEAIKTSGFPVTEIIEGGCRGVDDLARNWAMWNNIPFTTHEADWDTHGKRAGFLRNTKMAEVGEALIAVMPHIGSKGTTMMIKIAKEKGLPVYIYYV